MKPYSEDPEYSEWLEQCRGPLKHNLALLQMGIAQATRMQQPGIVRDLHKELLQTIRTNNAMLLEQKETWSFEERDTFGRKLSRAVAEVIKIIESGWQDLEPVEPKSIVLPPTLVVRQSSLRYTEGGPTQGN